MAGKGRSSLSASYQESLDEPGQEWADATPGCEKNFLEATSSFPPRINSGGQSLP
jgi:hypothetical protein